ncbi:hypothetical protein CDL12_09520 [Handroanthus impetiginosus]|uniref:Hydroxyproline O-arabinosyltransferase-like domain-containing protein n=1 Tax=Handroanthus impetiginosus TaxID=429701 RepID=A0A2G9HJW1_9LAMI|nr:hypothetical protein CDL12_09520 [Handroanthus impetiginosus]
MKKILVLMAAMAALLVGRGGAQKLGLTAPFRIHTLFTAECGYYFDWQTVGLMHSYRNARQRGPMTRLLSCTDEEEKKSYRGMDLAPTLEVSSMTIDSKNGDGSYKPAAIIHWLKHSKDADNVDWVVILDPDMIIRAPIIPWELGAEKGRPLVAYHGYLIECNNVLPKLNMKHSEPCDKFGGLLAIHIDDLRALAPIWLSKTEEIWQNRSRWGTNYTNDIYQTRWISEVYGYSFAAAKVGLRHKINDNVVFHSGYIPQEGFEPILMHYGLPLSVGNWSFSKLEHKEDDVVYDCHRLFPQPPYPGEVKEMEAEPNKGRALLLNMECVNTLNEGLSLQHAAYGCPKPKWSEYLSILRSKAIEEITQPRTLSRRTMEVNVQNQDTNSYPKIHTIFSAECSPYFDWQTVGLVHSFYKSGQPGSITRLLSCTEEDLKRYNGHDLAPTHYVPSMSRHPITGDWYPEINKPAAVVHWINHVKIDAEYVIILDADMIMKGPITPWEFNAAPRRPVSTPYDFLIGCDNELVKIHTRNPDACEKVGGVIIMHIRDVKRFALLWLHKTEQVRADMALRTTRNGAGDIYEAGRLSEMYGYVFAAAELNFKHVTSKDILIHLGHVPAPDVKYRVLHYALQFRVGNWSFDKAKWTHLDVVKSCWAKFPDPPDPSTLDWSKQDSLQRDLLSLECVNSLNEALHIHYERKKCLEANSLSPPVVEATPDRPFLTPPNRETTTSRKFGKLDEVDAFRDDLEVNNESQELSPPEVTTQRFSSMRVWMISLWAFSIFVFVIAMSMIINSQRRQKKRSKSLKNKSRTSN